MYNYVSNVSLGNFIDFIKIIFDVLITLLLHFVFMRIIIIFSFLAVLYLFHLIDYPGLEI